MIAYLQRDDFLLQTGRNPSLFIANEAKPHITEAFVEK